MNAYGIVFCSLIVLVAAGCAVVAIQVGKKPRTLWSNVVAGILGVLAGLAPIGVVVFLRLSIRNCLILNPLGLPWPEPWHDLAHWAGAAVWLASTLLLIVALVVPKLRRAGVAMLIWSAVIAIPTGFLFFLTIYGDAGAGYCTPV